MTTDRRAPLVLSFALIGISFAAPIIRLSEAAPLAISTWRLAFALVIIGVPLAFTGTWRQLVGLSRNDRLLAVGAGVALAIHFWFWTVSLRLTTIAASVVLVNTQPVIVAALSARWLHEAPTRRQWTGVIIALVGALFVGLADVFGQGNGAGLSTRALLGDGLALVSAVGGALYYLVGRRLRQKLDLWPYVAAVYGACFVTLVLASVGSSVALVPQPPRELAIFAALAAGPMLLGHTGMNWALKHVPAYIVNLITLGEPLGATLLAFLLPWIHEVPSVATLVGGSIVLIGVVVTAKRAQDAVGEGGGH